MLSIQKLNVSVGTKHILKDFTFDFEDGKVYAVMGPNGSGKSTLAYSIMGHPGYEISSESKLVMDGEDIRELEPDKRAKKGIFLSFQSPLSLSGVRPYQLIQLAAKGKPDALTLRKNVQSLAKELKIKDELLSRSLNEGASGGEKKKMEVLQAAALDKKCIIFDEVDTGVDVDALKTIAQFLEKNRKGKTYVVITHYNRILHYLKPDRILVIADGELKTVGDHTLADRIEKEGYENVLSK